MNDPRYTLQQMRLARIYALQELDILSQQAALMLAQGQRPEVIQATLEEYAKGLIVSYAHDAASYVKKIDDQLTSSTQQEIVTVIPQLPAPQQDTQSPFPQVDDALMKVSGWLDRLGHKLLTGD